jgi:carbohydrate-binding DOMON domain-containing protein
MPLFQVNNHNSNRVIVSVSKIENGLMELKSLLNNKASPQDLMKIVHKKFILV